MSHYTTVKLAKIKVFETLVAALEMIADDVTIIRDQKTGECLSRLTHKFPGFLPRLVERHAQVVAKVKGTQVVFGMESIDDHYQLIGDLWQTEYYNQENVFAGLILQAYEAQVAIEQLTLQGFTNAGIVYDVTGEMRITFDRVVMS